MFVHPQTHIWLVDQDRERGMTRRALERAARSGGEQRPGLVRGGIIGFSRLLRRAGSSVNQIGFGDPRPTTTASGSAAA